MCVVFRCLLGCFTVAFVGIVAAGFGVGLWLFGGGLDLWLGIVCWLCLFGGCWLVVPD